MEGGRSQEHPKLPAGGLETGSVDPGAGVPSGFGRRGWEGGHIRRSESPSVLSHCRTVC